MHAKYIKLMISLFAILFFVQPMQSSAENCDNAGCPVGGYAIVACPVTNDKVIRDTVINRLSGTVTPRANIIVVGVCSGIVTITGMVDTMETKQLATMLASRIKGVKCVRNYLAISPIGSWDLNVVRDVKNALGRSPIQYNQVHVNANNGIVELTGAVSTDYARDQAALIAASVDGVNAVHNGIAVINQGGTF